MNTRQIKGQEMAARLKIHKQDNTWIVPSQTGKGKYTVDIDGKIPKRDVSDRFCPTIKGKYTVDIDGKIPHCSCPDYELRGYKCKHIYAVEYTVKSEIDTTNQTVTVTKT